MDADAFDVFNLHKRLGVSSHESPRNSCSLLMTFSNNSAGMAASRSIGSFPRSSAELAPSAQLALAVFPQGGATAHSREYSDCQNGFLWHARILEPARWIASEKAMKDYHEPHYRQLCTTLSASRCLDQRTTMTYHVLPQHTTL
jgi:hypothetical protein